MEWVTAGLKVKCFRISIRRKLLLLSAVLFVVPWLGVTYIQDMEDFLRLKQEDNLLARAQVVAAVLQGQAEIFKAQESPSTQSIETPYSKSASHLYVRPLKRGLQLDGYVDDWLDFDEKSILVKSDDSASLEYRYYLASYRNYLYIVLKVKDDQLVYRKQNTLSLDKSDHVIINLRNKESEIKHYFIATQSPGWVNAHRMEWQHDEWVSVAPELRIKGEWQESPEGYLVEVRVPLALIGDSLSFYVADVDNGNDRVITGISAGSKISDSPGSIVIPSLKVEEMLQRINRPASRTWVIDKNYRVLAVAGDIKKAGSYAEGRVKKATADISSRIINVFYRMLLKQPASNFTDELSSASYLRGQVIKSALQGKASTGWRDAPDNQVRILTASYPVLINGEAIGAIAIEETSNAILLLQNEAMKILINLSVLTFIITIVVLLSYATWLSVRIRRLRDETEKAISNEGRIERDFRPDRSTDEIGDLSREFSGMLTRLSEYNRYLETMAGKLSHELRTPITVVRSSLEHLQLLEVEETQQVYIQRASEGMDRLSDILTRMSEATRLEQTLQSEHLQDVDIRKLIETCVEAYRIAYAKVEFEFNDKGMESGYIAGVPELLAQMMDKLISNAVDFHAESTPVLIQLARVGSYVQLSIVNQGEPLPEAMRENLFESMVSVRRNKGVGPHLGLGLYIVRMIADFHKGEVQALNLKNTSGVEIRINFPLINMS